MSDYVLPVGWKFYGSKENQTTFTGPGHTVAAPYLAIFDRVVPQNNGSNSVIPRYRVRVIRGLVDGEGNPLSVRPLIDCWIRWPGFAPSATVMDMMAVMGIFMSSAAFQDDVVVEQLLPRAVDSA